MHKIKFILFASLILLQLSCKKKETPAPASPVIPVTPAKKIDTIKPLPYFPVFPGSYWKYSNGDTYTTSATYKKDAYSTFGMNSTYKSDTVYVPFYNGVAIWGYNAHSEGQIQGYNTTVPFVLIVADSLPRGFSWITGGGGHQSEMAKIIAKDTSIIVMGIDYHPSIVVYYTYNYSVYYSFGPLTVPTMRRYYAKNIGLIKEEILNSDTTVTSEKHLVDYFINK